MSSKSKEKLVLAYSGGLDTSVIAHWLVHRKGYNVVTCEVGLGQNEDLKAATEKAHAVGASKVFVVDAVQDFVEQFAFLALIANAAYEHDYLLGTSLARPIIAREQIKIARKVGANWVSHGATGKGNDQVRFELTYQALMPRIKILSPWKNDDFLNEFNGREDLLEYAEKHGIPVEAKKKKKYSTDRNIIHSSHEGEILEDPSKAPPLEEILERTVMPQNAPDKTTSLDIYFEHGIPVMVHNKSTGNKVTGSVEIINYLNKIGGKNGIGIVDKVESRYVGMKSRGVYETPGFTILHAAHRKMESLTLDREVIFRKETMMPDIARLIYFGHWYSPEMETQIGSVLLTQEKVSGRVGVKLYKGNVLCDTVESDSSLYNLAQVSFEGQGGGFDQRDSTGFIRVTGTRFRNHSLSRGKVMGEKVYK